MGGEEGGARLRVGTYNLYLGADLSLLTGVRGPEELDEHLREVRRQLDATAFPRRAGTIARLLAEERLDLVGLQEVCTWQLDGAPLWDYSAMLLAELEARGAPYDVVVEHPTFTGSGLLPDGGRGRELALVGSNVLLRRRGCDLVVHGTAAGTFEESLTLRLLERTDVAVTRGWVSARVSAPGGPAVTVVATHTEAYDPASRERQRDELVTTLPGEDEPVVLLGDFNATPATVGMPVGLVDAWVAAGHASDAAEGATCGQAADLLDEESGLDERIDYVWVRGLEVLECHRFGADPGDRTPGGLWPSDHAGVAATLTWG